MVPLGLPCAAGEVVVHQVEGYDLGAPAAQTPFYRQRRAGVLQIGMSQLGFLPWGSLVVAGAAEVQH